MIIPSTNAIPETFPAHDFGVYGRAPKGYPINAADATREQRDTYVGAMALPRQVS